MREKKGAPDYTRAVEIKGRDILGRAVTVLLDENGRIQAIMAGQFRGELRTITVDQEGRLCAILYGMFGSTPVPVQVTQDGRLVFAKLDQAEIAADTLEAATWDEPIQNLVNNLNRIRNMITRITGKPWGQVEKAVPDYFHGTDGHKHLGVDGEGPKLGNDSLLPNIDASKIASGRFPLDRLPTGPSGYVLTGQGDTASPAWLPAPPADKLQPFMQITVPSHCQFLDITGLDVNAHKSYLLQLSVRNANTTTAVEYRIYFQGDYTDANYEAATTAGPHRYPYLASADRGAWFQLNLCIARHVLDFPVYLLQGLMYYGDELTYILGGGRRKLGVTNVTTIRIWSTATNGIGAGSTIRIFRVGG